MVPVHEVAVWEKKFLEFVHNQQAELHEALASKLEMTDELQQQIEEAIAAFQAQYASAKPAKDDTVTV